MCSLTKPILTPELSYSPQEPELSSPATSDTVLTPFFEHLALKESSQRPSSTMPHIYSPSPYSWDAPYRNERFARFPFDYSPPSKVEPLGLSPRCILSDSSRLSPGASSPPQTSPLPHKPSQTDSLNPQNMHYNLDACRFSSHFPYGHKLNVYFAQKYQLEDELGSGGYGFVMTAKHREAGHEVAVKFIIKDKVPENGWMEDEVIGKLPTEVMLLSFIDYENIVKCLDLFEDALYFYLVQELHGSPWPKAVRSRGYRSASALYSSPSDALSTPSLSPSASVDSLSSSEPPTPPQTSFLPRLHHENKWLQREPSQSCPAPRSSPEFSRRPSHDLFECIEQSEHKRLDEDQARYVFSQVVDAVAYLDANGIAHRDIKDENLVIDRSLKVKLIDFGSATIVDPNEPRPYYKLFFGTAAYASSEILRKKAYQAAPAEIWTLGVLLSFLLTGGSPFPTAKDAIEGRIVLADDPERLSYHALHLMKICLDPNPKTRATIAEVKRHPWLTRKF